MLTINVNTKSLGVSILKQNTKGYTKCTGKFVKIDGTKLSTGAEIFVFNEQNSIFFSKVPADSLKIGQNYVLLSYTKASTSASEQEIVLINIVEDSLDKKVYTNGKERSLTEILANIQNSIVKKYLIEEVQEDGTMKLVFESKATPVGTYQFWYDGDIIPENAIVKLYQKDKTGKLASIGFIPRKLLVTDNNGFEYSPDDTEARKINRSGIAARYIHVFDTDLKRADGTPFDTNAGEIFIAAEFVRGTKSVTTSLQEIVL
jgi:hypothetical protein